MTTPPYTPELRVNVQRVAPRRAIAEVLSCDIAEVEPYQRRRDADHGRQQYQVDGHVYVVLPAHLLSTPAPVAGLDPAEWQHIGTVHPVLSSASVVVLYRLGS
jgi:hypothetical protein